MTQGDYVSARATTRSRASASSTTSGASACSTPGAGAGIGPGQTMHRCRRRPGLRHARPRRDRRPERQGDRARAIPPFPVGALRAAPRTRGSPMSRCASRTWRARAGSAKASPTRAWCRWLLSFVSDPRRIDRPYRAGAEARRSARSSTNMPITARGGRCRPTPDVERFRRLVSQSWRDAGGEPDIAPFLPDWLAAAGMEIVEIRPLIAIVDRDSPLAWQWPAASWRRGARRLHELGYVGEERSASRARPRSSIHLAAAARSIDRLGRQLGCRGSISDRPERLVFVGLVLAEHAVWLISSPSQGWRGPGGRRTSHDRSRYGSR